MLFQDKSNKNKKGNILKSKESSTVKVQDKNKFNKVKNETNNKITDYFTQRKSNRKPASKIIEEKEQELIQKILNGCEDGLEV